MKNIKITEAERDQITAAKEAAIDFAEKEFIKLDVNGSGDIGRGDIIQLAS